jgi:hypothetical protein
VTQRRNLYEVLSEMPEVSRHLDLETLRSIEAPEGYLGSADAFRKRLLSSASDGDSIADTKKE